MISKISKRLIGTILIAGSAFLGGCHSIDSWDNSLEGNFDALWSVLDRHYCFFEQKDIDWTEVGNRYRAGINPKWNEIELFDHCAAMLDELHDGHTNLISWFKTSYYRKWWTDYPQNFDLRLIEEHYLQFDYTTGGGMMYKIIDDERIGYVRYGSFSAGFGDSFVNLMLYSMRECDGLIIDLRDNGGGALTNATKLASHFVNTKTLGGYITHKTGPGHNDFSDPYPYYIEPSDGVVWLKPVVILTNRSTYSAANNFVGMMKALPHVVVAGDVTGGGSGVPFNSEVPCGWGVRFSASPIYDAEMNLTEHGIEPTEGCRLNMNPVEALHGHDTILDFAIRIIEANADAAQTNLLTPEDNI